MGACPLAWRHGASDMMRSPERATSSASARLRLAGVQELAPGGAELDLLLLDEGAELREHDDVVLAGVLACVVAAGVHLLEDGVEVAGAGLGEALEAVLGDLGGAGLPLLERHAAVVARLVVHGPPAAVDEREGVVHDGVQAEVRDQAAELDLLHVVLA